MLLCSLFVVRVPLSAMMRVTRWGPRRPTAPRRARARARARARRRPTPPRRFPTSIEPRDARAWSRAACSDKPGGGVFYDCGVSHCCLRREARQQYIRFFLLPLRVARSGRFGRDAKSKTLENKSAHQQPGNHPHKKQEINHSRTQAKPQVTSAEMVSIVSIAVKLITQSAIVVSRVSFEIVAVQPFGTFFLLIEFWSL